MVRETRLPAGRRRPLWPRDDFRFGDTIPSAVVRPRAEPACGAWEEAGSCCHSANSSADPSSYRVARWFGIVLSMAKRGGRDSRCRDGAGRVGSRSSVPNGRIQRASAAFPSCR